MSEPQPEAVALDPRAEAVRDIVTRGKTSFRAGESLELYLEAGEGILVTLR